MEDQKGPYFHNFRPPRQPIFNLPTAVTWLVGLILAVHLLRLFLPSGLDQLVIQYFGFVPARIGAFGTAAGVAPDSLFIAFFGQLLPFFSHTFLHADLMHLTFNLLWLLAFGSAVARKLRSIATRHVEVFLVLSCLRRSGRNRPSCVGLCRPERAAHWFQRKPGLSLDRRVWGYRRSHGWGYPIHFCAPSALSTESRRARPNSGYAGIHVYGHFCRAQCIDWCDGHARPDGAAQAPSRGRLILVDSLRDSCSSAYSCAVDRCFTIRSKRPFLRKRVDCPGRGP